jgi:hypothetical protein
MGVLFSTVRLNCGKFDVVRGTPPRGMSEAWLDERWPLRKRMLGALGIVPRSCSLRSQTDVRTSRGKLLRPPFCFRCAQRALIRKSAEGAAIHQDRGCNYCSTVTNPVRIARARPAELLYLYDRYSMHFSGEKSARKSVTLSRFNYERGLLWKLWFLPAALNFRHSLELAKLIRVAYK